MRLKNKILIFILLTVSLCLHNTPKPASAITVSPIRIELSADPGDTAFGNFKIFNEKAEKVKYKIIFKTFRAKNETGEPDFTGENDEFISWIDAPEEVSIEPKNFKELTFRVNIPANAEPGAYFAAIFASQSPSDTSDNSIVQVSSETGSLILFRVNGAIKQGINILEFKTKDTKSSFTELPVWFYFRLQNGGTDYIKPLGDIVIKNIFGGTSKVIPTNTDKSNVLPGTIRKFEAAWLESGGINTQSIDAKVYPTPDTFFGHVIHQWNNFAFGKYTATLNLAYEKSSDNTAPATVNFWVIPWHLLAVIVTLGTVFFGGIILIAIIVAMFFIKLQGKKPKKKKKNLKNTRKKLISANEDTDPDEDQQN